MLLGKRVRIAANSGHDLGLGTCIEAHVVSDTEIRYAFLLDSRVCILSSQCTWEVLDAADAPQVPIRLPLHRRTPLYRQYGEHVNWIETSGEALSVRTIVMMRECSVKELVVPGLPEREVFAAIPIQYEGNPRFILADDLGLDLYGVD